MSPFEVVHGYQPRQLIDLIPIAPHHTRMSESGASFALYIHDLHKETDFPDRSVRVCVCVCV